MTHPLPSGWQEKKIIDISEVTSSKRIYEKEYVKNGIPFYRGKEISLLKNKEKIEEVIYISEEKYTELKNKYGVPQKNDILITAVGTIGNAYMVDNNDPFYFKDGNLIWLKNIKEHPKFLTFLFEYNQNKIIEISMGSSQKALTIIKLENLSFYFPPLEEQKRIAEVLSLCDDIIENLTELIEKKEQYKKGVMQRVLSGEVRFKGFTDEWKTVRLGDITEMSSGGTPNTKNKEYWNGNIVWVTIKDITSANNFLYDSEKKITKKGLENSSAKMFPINTILYAMYASIGECIISKVECTTSQAILGMECSEKIDFMFLYYLLVSYKNNAKRMRQTGTQPNLNKQIVSDFEFNIPSLEEQKKIAGLLSLIDEDIENLKKQLELRKQQKKGLMQRLLTGEVRI